MRIQHDAQPASRDFERKLLSTVFTLASTRDALTAIAISHVSRLWRDVALKTPAVWSFLDVVLGTRGAAAFIERSNSQPLDVHIHFAIVEDDAPSRIDSFLKCVLPQVQRWRSLSVDVPLASWMDAVVDGCAAALTGSVIALDLLSLRVNSNSEHLGYFSRRREGHRPPLLPFTATELVLDAVPAFQPALFSPRLSHVTLLNHRMPYAPGILAAHKLITVAPDLAGLLELLQQCHHLRTLVITASSPVLSKRVSPKIVLPELTSATFNTIDAPTLAALFEHTAVPSLVSLDLEWVGKAHAQVEPFLASLSAIVPHLRTLRVATVAEVSVETWTTVFTGLRSLTHVTLEAIGEPSNAVLPLVEAPALSSLALVHIDDLTREGLAHIVKTRLARDDVASLDYLEVAWCESLDAGDVPALCELVRSVKWVDDGDFDIDRSLDQMDLDDSDDDSDADSDEDEDDWDMDIKAELAMLQEFVRFPLFPPDEEVLTWSFPRAEISLPMEKKSACTE